MNKAQPPIDVEKEAKILKDSIQDIRENFDPEKLSKEAQDRIYEQLKDLKKLTLEVKAKLNEK